MGSERFAQFYTCDPGQVTAENAFYEARERAQYEHGHGGYTGTLAEKESFNVIALPAGKDPWEYADELGDGDPRVEDKWGPAGCLELPDGYLFFGWASS